MPYMFVRHVRQYKTPEADCAIHRRQNFNLYASHCSTNTLSPSLLKSMTEDVVGCHIFAGNQAVYDSQFAVG